MIVEVLLPKLGVEMETARLVEWTVAEGATVARDDVIANVETDKVVFELPAPAAGRIHLIAPVDEDYAIGDRLGAIAATDAEYAEASSGGAPAAPSAPAADSDSAPAAPAPADSVPSAASSSGERVLASPIARRMAAAAGVDLATLTGSGRGGAVRRRDVERAIATVPAPAPAAPAPAGERLSSMRQTIAKRMHASLRDTAQMTDIREHDVSALVGFRAAAVARADTLGFRLSYTTLIARAALLALERVPELNATMISETELVRYDSVSLGMAVAIPDGLLVPVLHHAEMFSVRRLHEELAALIDRARDRTAGAEELTGGTFTITNFGSYGTHMGTPILLPPQIAILGIGALLDRPVVRDGAVVPGKVMYTSLTVDHRIVDGETAGRFQNELGALLAEPDRILYG